MPIPQTTYPEERPTGFPGQPYGTGVMAIHGWSSAALPAGVGMVAAAGAREYALPASGAAAGTFRGISKHEHGRDDAKVLTDPDLYAANEDFPLGRQGFIFGRVDQVDVAEDGEVHLIIDTAGGGTIGSFRGSADGANTVRLDDTQSIRCHVAGTAASGVAVFELNLP